MTTLCEACVTGEAVCKDTFTCSCPCTTMTEPNALFLNSELGTELLHISMLKPMSPVYNKSYERAVKSARRNIISVE